MIDVIVDVAHTLADTCQRSGVLPTARRAVLGNRSAVKDTADKLAELAAALDVSLDEETNELVRKMLDPRQCATAVRVLRPIFTCDYFSGIIARAGFVEVEGSTPIIFISTAWPWFQGGRIAVVAGRWGRPSR